MSTPSDVVNRVREDDDGATGDGSLWKRAGLVGFGGYVLRRGLDRRSVGGALLAGVGGYAIYRGLRGDGTESKRGEGASAGESAPHDVREISSRPGIERSVTIRESAAELTDLTRDPETLDRLVGPFVDVEPIDDDGERLRWTVSGPSGLTAAWETELLAEQPGEFSRWRSTEETVLPIEYSLSFRPAPADRGTEVTLRLWLDPPGGALGTAVASRLLGRNALVTTALYRLKSLAETGEIPTLDRNPSARGRGDLV